MLQQKFTLNDLFNNDELKGVLPQIHSRKTKKKSGITFDDGREIYFVTHHKKFNDAIDMVLQTGVNGARNSMTNVKLKKPMYMTAFIDGKVRKSSTITNAYNDVLNAIKQQSYMIKMFGGNNGNIIKDTMERIANKTEQFYKEPKLWLNINSLEQIKAMDRPQKAKFIKSVIENIYFNDDFESVRTADMKKGMFITNSRNALRGYDQLKREFDRKVGVK